MYIFDEIKNWPNNLNFDLEIDNKHSYKEIEFINYKTEKYRQFFKITSLLDNDIELNFNKLWDIKLILEINKNLISNIEILEKKLNYQLIKTDFSFKSKNLYIEKISRKDIFFYEKEEKIYIYGEN